MCASPVYQRLISADSHIREPTDLWLKAIGKRFGERTPRVVSEGRGGRKGKYFYNGIGFSKVGMIEDEFARHYPDLQGVAADPAQRLKFMERANIAAEMLNPTQMSNIMPGRDVEMIQAAAQVVNDYMAEFISHDRSKLLGNGMIPMHDVDWATREVKRCRDIGLNGVIINTVAPEGAAPYRHRKYDPFWSTVQDLDLPITLHIITGRVLDPILYAETEEERAEAPVQFLALFEEIQISLANDFIFGGIFDRFPRLKLVAGEFEIGWIPDFNRKVDQMQEAFASLVQLPPTRLKPSEYVTSRVYHGLIDDYLYLDVIKRIGTDNIVWGTDFPHVRSVGMDAQDVAHGMFKSLARVDQEKIVGGTMAKLYGLS
jgi:uncharacterized protein